MRQVVKHGSGKKADIKGYAVIGKTGTAEDSSGGADHAWFAGFAPYDSGEIVIVAFAHTKPLALFLP